mmetsp:Transcript_25761/g.69640  ORF Transcript_25761/g.69640 Transcript_25761/m.69640 type:complete len:300 (-) Transcript_25761:459-1358(-)
MPLPSAVGLARAARRVLRHLPRRLPGGGRSAPLRQSRSSLCDAASTGARLPAPNSLPTLRVLACATRLRGSIESSLQVCDARLVGGDLPRALRLGRFQALCVRVGELQGVADLQLISTDNSAPCGPPGYCSPHGRSGHCAPAAQEEALGRLARSTRRARRRRGVLPRRHGGGSHVGQCEVGELSAQPRIFNFEMLHAGLCAECGEGGGGRRRALEAREGRHGRRELPVSVAHLRCDARRRVYVLERESGQLGGQLRGGHPDFAERGRGLEDAREHGEAAREHLAEALHEGAARGHLILP